MTNIPWKMWFQIANQLFHLSPDQFWRLSIIEWQWFMEVIMGSTDDFMPRNIFENLIDKYPDISHG